MSSVLLKNILKNLEDFTLIFDELEGHKNDIHLIYDKGPVITDDINERLHHLVENPINTGPRAEILFNPHDITTRLGSGERQDTRSKAHYADGRLAIWQGGSASNVLRGGSKRAAPPAIADDALAVLAPQEKAKPVDQSHQRRVEILLRRRAADREGVV